ncbi:dihydroxyacetone kinase subunit L [Streptomyces sp. XM4193]|uniref:dihydroxyacetone kinase subunit DhaL n=1 Tax=Streptomyces sp. XM4193 TaxID=2929782 RepID=UPI001FFB1C97|nr:dihydroxyacetone kinase subunit DhaL [Streptomyces sp. XM4193]MCK1797699.1 dihydroxyacetone kinase subunit L [Streptomyces sp. XM4193]
MAAAARAMTDNEQRLTELDSPIGDADHGGNMRRGFQAVTSALDSAQEEGQLTGPGAVLTLAGRTLISKVGGASGPLYGTLLRRVGKTLGDEAEVDPSVLGEGLRAGVEGVVKLGGAAVGDKTMVDALQPAVDALESGFAAASQAALRGAEGTVPLRARKGRASYLGERSVGHQDPGATSAALLLGALAEVAGDE